MNLRGVEVEWPYANQRDDPTFVPEIDPAAKGSSLRVELEWMIFNAKAEEWNRILTAWALLNYLEVGTLGECLHTAIIWERG